VGKADLRTKQAIGLREWARDQNVGVINIGDFNMDYDSHTKKGNEAFPEMLRDNVYEWVKPAVLIDCSGCINLGLH
jgi:endonuclease/exonuclease/phosphatase family metal-dependent hydrolase